MENRERNAVTADNSEYLSSIDHKPLCELSENIRDTSGAVLDSSNAAMLFFASILSSFAVLFKEQPQKLRLLMPLLLMLFLNGCMYSPKLDDYYSEAEVEISYQEQHQRKQRVNRFLSIENLPKSTAAIITSGINTCQKDRIKENFEFIIEDSTPEAFEEYLSLCEKAKRICGIMNPDRYSPRLLAEIVKNYESREYNAGCRQILVFTSREDNEKTFLNIQALNVDTHRLEELMNLPKHLKFKLIVIETSTIEEINTHLDRLQTNGILEDGRLKGALVIGHGDQDEVENGLTMGNMSALARLNRLWVPDKKSFFVYFSCLSAEGGYEENNMVNSTAVVCPETRVYGSSKVVEKVDFKIDKKRGEFIPEALELSTYFSFTSDTFLAIRSGAVNRQARRTQLSMSESKDCNADLSFFENAVNQGITQERDIQIMCTSNIPAQTYSALSAAGWERYEFLAHRPYFDMPYAKAIEYADAGVRGRQDMTKLHLSNITPAEIRVLRATTKMLHIPDSVIQTDKLVAFKNTGIDTQDLLPYLLKKETNIASIIQSELERRAIIGGSSIGIAKVATR